MLKPVKDLVERFPLLALVFRTARDHRALRRLQPRETRYGFRLMGHAGMERGEFEESEVSLVRSLLPDTDLFIDVGANIGLYTCLARASAVPVIAVEPLQHNLQYLYRNLLANDWTDGFEVYPVGLSNKPGLATLYGASTGASLVRGWAGASPLLQQTIPLTTLDLLLRERPRGKRTLIKIDVEGAEYQLLHGAPGTLRSAPRPRWLVEINLTENHPQTNAVFRNTFELFWAEGYKSWRVSETLVPVTVEDVRCWCDRPENGPASANYFFAESAPAKVEVVA